VNTDSTTLNDFFPPVAQVVAGVVVLALVGVWIRLRRAAKPAVSPLNLPARGAKSEGLNSTPQSPVRRVVTGLLFQALIWCALTFAFAALLRVSGPLSWTNTLRFAALNWMPWAILAPGVFWLTGRFPLERGHLLKSIPAHVIGCAACVTVTVWVAAYVGYSNRPPGRFEERRSLSEPAAPEHEGGPDRPDHGGVQPRGEPPYAPSAFEHTARPEHLGRGEPRPPFGRRGPMWWPWLGGSLLRANFDAAVYLIIMCAGQALAFYRRAQERERHAAALTAGLHRAKLDALRLQLQPHFLFNTLNAISTLVHRDASAADELIGDLSDLLRVSLQTTDHEVPLAKELELLERYVAIEKARLGDRLRVVRIIDPATENALVPTFLLQPLVENAVRHGIEPRLAPGTVTISARRQHSRLELSVSDDGVGLPAKTDGQGRRGIGITNTEERLRALHGSAATLALEQSPAGGVTVRISLPFSTLARASGNSPARGEPSPELPAA
jgi:anti-sigma regulatory factor (Ser/Thr protein kinase)